METIGLNWKYHNGIKYILILISNINMNGNESS